MAMFNRTTEAGLRLLSLSARALAIDLPGPLAEAFDTHAQLTTALQEFRDRPVDLPGAIMGATRAGKDPAADRTVQRELTALQIRNQFDEVADLSVSRLAEVGAAQFDALVECLRPPFEHAAELLTSAHEVIGTIDLDNAAALIARGPQAAAAWHDAQRGITTARQVTEAWGAVYGHFGRTIPPDPRWSVLILAEPSDGDFTPLTRLDAAGQRQFGIWNAVLAGWHLDLATQAEFERRAQRMHSHAAQRQPAPSSMIIAAGGLVM